MTFGANSNAGANIGKNILGANVIAGTKIRNWNFGAKSNAGAKIRKNIFGANSIAGGLLIAGGGYFEIDYFQIHVFSVSNHV